MKDSGGHGSSRRSATDMLHSYFSFDRGERHAKPVNAIVDRGGKIVTWSTAQKRAVEKHPAFHPEDGHSIKKITAADFAKSNAGKVVPLKGGKR